MYTTKNGTKLSLDKDETGRFLSIVYPNGDIRKFYPSGVLLPAMIGLLMDISYTDGRSAGIDDARKVFNL
jgi:hypothetical protein